MLAFYRPFIAAAALGLAASPSIAAGKRTFVSASGSDTPGCSQSAPCRTINFAIQQTDPGGEMLVLNSAAYGTFTVDRAITINSPPGIQAFVNAAGGVGVTVSAGPSDLVILTGFFINGFGTGSTGIQINTVGSFSLSGSTVAQLTGNAINYTNNSATGVNHLTVNASSFYSNGGGVFIQPTGGNTQANLSNSFFSGATITADATGGGSVSGLVDNCVIRFNSGNGIFANGGFVQVHRSAFFGVSTALAAAGTGSIDLNLSSLSNVSTVASGTVRSFGNNGIAGSGNSGSLTTIPLR